MDCNYMKWVTDNVDTFVRNEVNLVACVSCKEIYETKYFRVMHNCLVCKCGIDALMVVKHSPLKDLTDEERKAQLEKWHDYGFTPLPPPLRKSTFEKGGAKSVATESSEEATDKGSD